MLTYIVLQSDPLKKTFSDFLLSRRKHFLYGNSSEIVCARCYFWLVLLIKSYILRHGICQYRDDIHHVSAVTDIILSRIIKKVDLSTPDILPSTNLMLIHSENFVFYYLY